MHTARITTTHLLALALAASTPTASRAQAGDAASSREVAASRELAAERQAVHVLNRLAFGPRPGDVERVRRMGVDRWIAGQLRPETIDDAAAERVVAGYATLDRDPAELLRDYPPPGVALRRRRVARDGPPAPARNDTLERRRARQRAANIVAELTSAKVARAVSSERQLQEVMVDFWENHFNVYAGKGQLTRYFLADFDRNAIRPHALGNFRDLLGAVAKSPAMLYYLDNWQSTADSGRPTLGVGRATDRGTRRGRAMAGRGVRDNGDAPGSASGDRSSRGGAPTPDSARRAARPPRPPRPRGLNENYARELLELHTLGVDGGYTQQDIIDVARALTGWTIRAPKHGGGFVFNPRVHDAGGKVVLGHALPAGRGIEDGEDVLDLVARHPATARFIAGKLARRFVSDTPPAALVERAAAAFTRTNGDIGETVRVIVTSPEFFSRAAYRAKVKSPFEVVASALRAVDAAPDTTVRTARLVARLGQPLFGHQAPDGYPETGSEWMNAGAILNRINFGLALAAGRVAGARADGWPGAARLAGASREAQVDGVVRAMLGGDVSAATRAVLVSGRHPMLADRATGGAAGGEAAMAVGPAALDGLAQVVGLALGSPEFQRR